MTMAASRGALSEYIVTQLELVEVLEEVFNGDLSSVHASTLEDFDDLADGYNTLGDFYLQEGGYHSEAIDAKERAVHLKDEALQLVDKDAQPDRARERLNVVVEHFANLGYLCKEDGHLDKALGFYEASTVRARQSYGAKSLDYAMTLVPHASCVLIQAKRDMSTARLQLILSRLDDSMVTLLLRELGDDHELSQEAIQIVADASALQVQLDGNNLLDAALGSDSDNDDEGFGPPMMEGEGSPSVSLVQDTDSLIGGNSVSTLGVKSAVSFEDGATVMSENYPGAKAAAAALSRQSIVGAFGGTHSEMLAMINEKADLDAQKEGDEAGGGGGADVGDIASTGLDVAVSLKTTVSRAHEVVRSVEVLHETGDKLEYSVDYLPLNPEALELVNLFRRKDDAAYDAACGPLHKHEMGLFPAQLKEGGRYRGESVRLARYGLSCRIRRLTLNDEVQDLRDKIQEWQDTYDLCVRKKENHKVRMLALENELPLLAEDRNANGAKTSRPIESFSVFLTTRDGWKVVVDLLHREVKRLQNPEHNLAGTEEVHDGLTLQDCQEIWQMLFYWQLFYSTQVRARVGLKHYPVHAREEKKKVAVVDSDDEESESEKKRAQKAAKKAGKKSQKQKDKDKAELARSDAAAMEALKEVDEEKGDEAEAVFPDDAAVGGSRPDTAISQMEEHLTKIREASMAGAMAEGESMLGSQRDDFGDASTIVSGSSFGRNAGDDDDGSINSTPSMQAVPVVEGQAIESSSENKKKKKEKDETAEENKTSSGGWGFGNMFSGSKEEEVEEKEEEAVVITLEERITTNNGVGVCEWGEVCKLLGCTWTEETKDQSLLGACKSILSVIESHLKNPTETVLGEDAELEPGQPKPNKGVEHCLKGSVTRIDVNDLVMGINELLPQDFINAWVESVMIKLTNAIANTVQSRFMESLRHYSKWCSNLENMRKDRIKKEGGSLKEEGEGTTEVDKHGQIRIIANADQVVDSDVVHGNKQRSQISVVMPLLVTKLESANRQLFELEGELACCIQFMFVLATPYIQRAIRGTLGRMRRNLRRFDSTYHSLHMAAVLLQGWVRGIFGRKAFKEKKAGMMSNILELMAISCQKNIRMFIHAHKYRKYVKDKKDASEWFALTKFQAMIRGFNARHRTAKKKAANESEKLAEIKDWGIGLLQRWARGCIARGTIIRSLKVRKTISKDVLLMSEKYLNGGDLWGFLKQVDDHFSVLNKQITDNQEKENEYAATFVQQVLAKRQGDFDGAWDRFSGVAGGKPGEGPPPDPNTLSAVGETDKGSWGPGQSGTRARSPSRGANTKGGASTAGSVASGASVGGSSVGTSKSRTGTGNGTGNGQYAKTGNLGPGNDTSVPGPLLRRAVSATVKEGIVREKKNQRVDVDPMDYPGSHKARQKEEAASGKSRPGQGSAKKKQAIKMVNGKPVKSKPKKGEPSPKGKMYATTTDWSWASATGTLTHEIPPPPDPRVIHPGESLLIDIPKGLDDQLERMIHCISLVTYIPEFSNAESAEEAYELYKTMPNGLAKMRYEIEAHKWCQPQINKLRLKGIHTIRDGLPMNKFRQYLNSVDVPLPVVGMAVKWVKLLQAMGDLPAGKVHTDTADRQADVKAGIGTVGQLKNVGIKSPTKDGGAGSSKKVVAVQLADGTTVYQEESETSSKPQDGDTVMVNGVEVKVETKPVVGDEETAGKVLLNLVEGGEWASLSAKAEDLLLHAAFLVVPHSTVRVDKFGTHEDFTEMGHQAFKLHTKALQRYDSEDERREAVRKRFRAALLLSTPFSLRLKTEGILTVQDLVKSAEIVTKLNLPPQLHTQVESMLSTAVGAAVSAKQAPTIRDHCDTAAETFTVPMIYDQKFQRGPFDPYGKPPRFITPALLKSNTDKKKEKKRMMAPSPIKKKKGFSASATSSITASGGGSSAGAEDEDDDDDDDDDEGLSGRGLWEKKLKKQHDSNTIKNVDRLFSLQTHGQHVSQEEKDEEEELRKQIAAREAEWGNAPEDEYALLEKQNAAGRDDTAARKARLLMHDFEARVRAGFERPFKCRFDGCNQAFSRAYTLKIHEKSHKLFGNYHKWKKDPQLFLDKDKETMAKEAHDLAESRTILPPIVLDDIEALKETAHRKAVETAYFQDSGGEQYGDLYGKLSILGVDTDIEEKQLSMKLDACRWPAKQAPAAAAALGELPPSRGASRENTPSAYERPFTGAGSMDGGAHPHQNWGMGANADKKGQEISLRASGSRGGSRGSSTRALSPVRGGVGGSRGSSRGKLDRTPGGKATTPKLSKSKSRGKMTPEKRPVSPSHDILRQRLEQERQSSPLFRAIHSRERLSSKGNVPPVDSLRSMVQACELDTTGGSMQGLSIDSEEWAGASSTFDFQSVSVSSDLTGLRPGTGFSVSSLSRPGTVDSIAEGNEHDNEMAVAMLANGGLRFGAGFADDEFDENEVQVVDPFAANYDEAY